MPINPDFYTQDFKYLLIPRIRNNQTYVDLFNAMSEVFNNSFYYAIEQLRILRDSTSQDRTIKIALAKDLSFDYKSDLFTDDEYDSVNLFANKFNNKVKGTEDFIQFLGWVKGAKFKCIQLWATGEKDYENFSEYTNQVKQNSKIDEMGTKSWYPTSHVNLEYDGNLSSIDESDIEYLFYKCAPIHLVLNAYAAAFTAEIYNLCMYILKPYTNTHFVIPYVFKNIINLYLSTIARTKSLDTSTLAQTTYLANTYNNIISFNKSMDLQTLTSMKVYDNRNCVAEYTPKNSFKAVFAPKNTARLDYLPESSNQHHIAKGILIESQSMNYLLNSFMPATRSVNLFAGTYTFSGIGTYEIYKDNDLLTTVSDSSYTFILSNNARIKCVPVSTTDASRFQLEPMRYATSFIKTTDMATTRLADSLYYNIDFAYNGLFARVKLDNDVKNTSGVLLYLMFDYANYIEIRRNNDKINFNLVRNTASIYTGVDDYTGDVFCYINNEYIQVNNINYPMTSLMQVNFITFGSRQGNNAIDGHITDLEVYGF